MDRNNPKGSTARRWEYLRYLVGCGCNLLLKMGLTALLELAGITIEIAYLLTNIVIIFCSFFFHHFITFRQECFGGWRPFLKEFLHYTLVIIGLIALDYLIVLVGIRLLEPCFAGSLSESGRRLFHSGMILCSSGFIFVLRFFFYRLVFRKGRKNA